MWDQATYLPQGGSEARARQISLVAGLLQQKQTSHELGKLIDDVTPLISQLAPEASDAAARALQ